MENKIRLLIIDDNSILREGLVQIFSNQPELVVVGECDNEQTAIEIVKTKSPDIIILNINIPTINVLELTKKIKIISPKSKVLGTSQHRKVGFTRRLIKAGASGYVSQDAGSKEVINAVYEVAKGNLYACPDIKYLFSGSGQRNVDKPKTPELLTKRESQLVRLIKKGKSSEEIAILLQISPQTVVTHRCNVLKKLGVNGL